VSPALESSVVDLTITRSGLPTGQESMALHHCRIETPACWSLASTLHNPAAECAGYYQGGLGPDHNMFANCTYNHESGACQRSIELVALTDGRQASTSELERPGSDRRPRPSAAKPKAPKSRARREGRISTELKGARPAAPVPVTEPVDLD